MKISKDICTYCSFGRMICDSSDDVLKATYNTPYYDKKYSKKLRNIITLIIRRVGVVTIVRRGRKRQENAV